MRQCGLFPHCRELSRIESATITRLLAKTAAGNGIPLAAPEATPPFNQELLMKRFVFVACASLAVLVFPVRAFAQHAHADSPKTTLTVTTQLVVGTTILQPGQYRFQCRTFDGRTFL